MTFQVAIMVLASITLILLGVGLTMKTERQIMLRRVRKYSYEEASQAPVLADDLVPSFSDRVLRPGLGRVGKMLNEMTPGRSADVIRRRLESAGRPFGLTPQEFSALKSITLFVGLLAGIGISIAAPLQFLQKVSLTLGFAFVGFYAPERWLGQKIARRKNEIQRALPNAIDLLKTAHDFGDKLGEVMKANQQLESLRKEMDNSDRVIRDILRRERICKEPQAKPPQEPEPRKPEPGRKPAPPKPPGQPPQPPAPPGAPPREPPSEPPSVPPPPYQPPPTRTLALPFDQSCTCGAGRGVTASADGLATLQTGLGQMKSCNAGFEDQARGFQGALQSFSAILDEMSSAKQVPVAQRDAKAKQWSARLGQVVDQSRKFEAAGKAVLQNGQACPAAMDASVGIMTSAATSPLTAR